MNASSLVRGHEVFPAPLQAYIPLHAERYKPACLAFLPGAKDTVSAGVGTVSAQTEEVEEWDRFTWINVDGVETIQVDRGDRALIPAIARIGNAEEMQTDGLDQVVRYQRSFVVRSTEISSRIIGIGRREAGLEGKPPGSRSERRLLKPVRRDILVARNTPHVSTVAGAAVAPDVSVVPVNAVVNRTVRRIEVGHEPILVDDFAEITTSHVDEDAFIGQVVTNVRTRGCVEMPINLVGDVVASTIKQEPHASPPVFAAKQFDSTSQQIFLSLRYPCVKVPRKAGKGD